MVSHDNSSPCCQLVQYVCATSSRKLSSLSVGPLSISPNLCSLTPPHATSQRDNWPFPPKRLPCYEDFCNGVLPNEQSVLSPILREARSRLVTDRDHLDLSVDACNPPLTSHKNYKERTGSVILNQQQCPAIRLGYHVGTRAFINDTRLPGPRLHTQHALTASSALLLDAVDSCDQPNQTEPDTLSEGKRLRRNVKNEEALKYIYDRGDGNDTMWLQHVEKGGVTEDGHELFRCIHPERQKRGKSSTTDASEECGYSALRQTVRRHVESTHLRIARYLCTFCKKAFSQRQAAAIHVNGSHLGIKNIACEYCKELFSDPSRKNKHVARYHPEAPLKSRRKDPYKHLLRR